MKEKKLFVEFNIMLFILICMIIVSSFLNISRYVYYENVLVGEEPYYHERMSSELLNGFFTWDNLSYSGVPYFLNPYHLFLGFFIFITKTLSASKFVPFILGFISIFLFYYVLVKLKVNIKRRFLAAMLFLLSPPFIYNSFVSNNGSLVIFLEFLAVLFFMNSRKYLYVLSLLITIAIPFFGVFHAFVFFLILLLYSFYKKRYERVVISSIVLFITSLYYLSFYQGHNINFIQRNLATFITEMGSLHGLSVFLIILGFIGVTILWKYKARFYSIYISSFIIIALSLYKGVEGNIYLALLLSIFGAFGFYRLIYMRWEAKIIKNLTLFILVAGIVLSSFSYSLRLINLPPNKEQIQSLEWLRENSVQGIVLSHYSKGFWIENKANLPVFMDSLFITAPAPNSRYNISNEIFYSRDLRKTTQLLQKNRVKYIWIDKDMKEGRVWSEAEEGLLFLFKNNETFKNIYRNNDVEIWEFLTKEN